MAVPTDHAVYLQRKGYVPTWPSTFTAEETALLARFGHWMEALAAGAIEPVTPEQSHFLQVTRGEASPESAFERVWVKLRQQETPAAGEAPPSAEPPEESAELPPPESGDTRTKFEELLEARQYLEALQQQQEAEREAILSTVKAELEVLDAKFGTDVEAAQRAVEELTAELKAAVVRTGKSARLGNIQAVFYRGRVTWDGKGLQKYAESHPELERFRKVGEPGVALRFK